MQNETEINCQDFLELLEHDPSNVAIEKHKAACQECSELYKDWQNIGTYQSTPYSETLLTALLVMNAKRDGTEIPLEFRNKHQELVQEFDEILDKLRTLEISAPLPVNKECHLFDIFFIRDRVDEEATKYMNEHKKKCGRCKMTKQIWSIMQDENLDVCDDPRYQRISSNVHEKLFEKIRKKKQKE